jgi:cobaltochelatase CobN
MTDHVIAENPTEITHGILSFKTGEVFSSLSPWLAAQDGQYQSCAGMLIHLSNWLQDDLAAFRAMADALQARGIAVIPVLTDADSLDFRELADRYFSANGKLVIDILINGILYLVKARDGNAINEQAVLEFERLGLPVISPAISYYITPQQWAQANIPLSADMPNALIAPEMSGMIETVLVGARNGGTEKTEALEGQAQYLAARAAAWINLRKKTNGDKKLALILHNSVCSGVEATIGKAFGLDAFQSVVDILSRLKAEGYQVGDYPPDGKALLQLIREKKAISDFRWTAVEDIAHSGGCLYRMDAQDEYQNYYRELPVELQASMEETWGPPPGEGMVLDGDLIVTGLQFGNVAVMVQPKRGCYGAKCTGEVCKILHDPACPPPHQYLATYRFIERVFKADAIIDIGTDGSLEYLPGKTNGLSALCWPRAVQGSLPSVYIYNAGVPNEALLAKRRMNAVIVDHLPPSSSGADESTKLLDGRIFDYFRSLELDNGQEGSIREEILSLLDKSPSARRVLDNAADFNAGLSEISDAIKTAAQARQIGGSHVFGAAPGAEETENYVREVLEGEGIPFEDAENAGADGLRAGLARCGSEMDMLLQALRGGYVPAGESGMPDENGRNILPTGRNMFGMNIDKIPSKLAFQRGKVLAEQLLDSFARDEGKLPEKIAMNMISLDITRTNGEQLSQFLYLLGVTPLWDKQERVHGLRALDTRELGRPRIDVTVRISGVLRDTWPMAIDMMDEAVRMVTAQDEGDAENYVLKHLREHEDGDSAIRIFGDAPGTYGAGLDLALLASAWNSEADLVKYFINASAYAYGKNRQGERSVREFIENAKQVDLSCDATSSRRAHALACNFGAQVQGGYRLMAKHLGKKSIRQYQGSNERGQQISTETLEENIRRLLGETLLNPFWKENIQKKEYDGASDIMHMMQNVFATQCLTEYIPDELLDRLTETYVNDEETRAWFAKHNLYALEEIGRRMLELNQRGKWKGAEEVLDRLKENYLHIEGDMEEGLESHGEIQGGAVDIVTDAEVPAWKAKLMEIEKHMAD